jgi:hypothetical protein
VIGRNLDHDDPNAVGVLDPHLDQTPGLGSRLPYNQDSSRGQPGVLGVDIPRTVPPPWASIGPGLSVALDAHNGAFGCWTGLAA